MIALADAASEKSQRDLQRALQELEREFQLATEAAVGQLEDAIERNRQEAIDSVMGCFLLQPRDVVVDGCGLWLRRQIR